MQAEPEKTSKRMLWFALAVLMIIVNIALAWNKTGQVFDLPFLFKRVILGPLLCMACLIVDQRFRNTSSMLKIFVFASLFFTFSLLPFPEFEQKRTLSRDFLEEVATEANKKMPLFIDDELKITHIEAREGMFIYHAISLTETNEDYADEQFMEEVRIDIAESICATQLKERFIAKGVTMRYRIQDIRENFLADIDVSQEDCSDQ